MGEKDNALKEKKFISAVVYLRNDAEHVEGFLNVVTTALSENFTGYELIFVNDASTDDSVMRIRRFYEEHAGQAKMASIIFRGRRAP